MKNTDERNRELVVEVQENLKELLEGNEYLIRAIVEAYDELDISDYPKMRVIANMALIKAATKYPLDSPHKFSTYATWWMRIAIQQELGLPLETTVK